MHRNFRIGFIEGANTAKRAAAVSQRAVAIGAGESGMQRQFPHALAEAGLQMLAEGVDVTIQMHKEEA